MYKTPYDHIGLTTGEYYTRIGSGNIPVEATIKYDIEDGRYYVAEVLSEGVDIKDYVEHDTLAEIAEDWVHDQLERGQ
jgi:hypothetical protein